MNKDIGEKIRDMRQQKGLTQLELARKAKVAQSTLSYIEKGAKTPRFETLNALCSAMGITLFELLTFGEPTHPTRFLQENAGSAPAGSFEHYLYRLLLGKEPQPAVCTSSACESENSV